MTAYMIVDLDVHDQEGFQENRDGVPALIAKHGALREKDGSWR